MILISGATGQVGSEIVRSLSTREIPFRGMVRRESDARRLAEYPGAEPVVADFDDADSLARALQGVERAFLVTPSSAAASDRQRRFVDIAARAGVRHVVKLSQLHADRDSPVRFLRYHAVVEDAIRDSGMAWTFLRPNLFMQGLLIFRQSIVSQGRFAIAAGRAGVSVVDVRDIAASAVAALTGPGHAGKIYDLTGPAAVSHAQMASVLSRVLGHPVEYVDPGEDGMRESLLAHGMPTWMTDGVVEDYAHYRRGEADSVTDGVLEASGRPPRALETFVRDHADVFLQQ